MKMWHKDGHTTKEQAEINRGRLNDGKISKVEDTPPTNDDNDVNISVESNRMVHDTAQSNDGAVGACQCSDGSNDRCVCGMAGA